MIFGTNNQKKAIGLNTTNYGEGSLNRTNFESLTNCQNTMNY